MGPSDGGDVNEPFEQGIWEAFASRSDTQRSAALLELSAGLAGEGDLPEALQAALAAVELAQQRGDEEARALAWMAAGRAQAELDQHALARGSYLQAVEGWEGLLQWREQGRCLLAAFDAGQQAGVDEDDEPLLQRAYLLLLGVNDAHAASYAATRLAQRELARGETEAALALLSQARKSAGGDLEMVLTINDVEAEVHLDSGGACVAVPLLLQALDLAETVRGGQYPKYEAWRLVRALRADDRHDDALVLARAGLAEVLREQPADADAAGSFHLEIALCLHDLGHVNEARQSLRKAWHHLLITSNTREMDICRQTMQEWGDSEPQHLPWLAGKQHRSSRTPGHPR